MSDAAKDYRPELRGSIRAVQVARLDDARRLLSEAELALRFDEARARRFLTEAIATLADLRDRMRKEEDSHG